MSTWSSVLSTRGSALSDTAWTGTLECPSRAVYVCVYPGHLSWGCSECLKLVYSHSSLVVLGLLLSPPIPSQGGGCSRRAPLSPLPEAYPQPAPSTPASPAGCGSPLGGLYLGRSKHPALSVTGTGFMPLAGAGGSDFGKAIPQLQWPRLKKARESECN